MGELQEVGAAGMARETLANLVSQFANPMDFLRELVQNAIDAGTPRVDVYATWEAEPRGMGVLQLHVDDYGAGMDEAIIDGQLTRLFSSNKEDDLTKIGKFGIGFASIFAPEPDLVRLRTGRHGEAWELLFFADRTFEKHPVGEAVQGTAITLYKRMAATERDAKVAEAERVLRYWCEHSLVPITFEDRTRGAAAQADPFAMFGGGDGGGACLVSGPLTVGVGAIEVLVDSEGVQGAVGYADRPRYGFYNSGLTLVNTDDPLVLGVEAASLAPLSIKLQYAKLGHTLARDGVVRDGAWERALKQVRAAIPALRDKLIAEAEVREGAEYEEVLGFLLRELRREGRHRTPWLAERLMILDLGRWDWVGAFSKLFVDATGQRVTLREVEAQAARLGAILIDCGPGLVRQELLAQGTLLLADRPIVRALLAELFPAYQDRILPADQLFVALERVDRGLLDDTERALLDRTSTLLERVSGGRLSLEVGEFGARGGGALVDAFAIEGSGEERVFRRPEHSWFRLPRWLRWRRVLLNRSHPSYRNHLACSRQHVDMGALPLAFLLLGAFDYGERGDWAAALEVLGE